MVLVVRIPNCVFCYFPRPPVVASAGGLMRMTRMLAIAALAAITPTEPVLGPGVASTVPMLESWISGDTELNIKPRWASIVCYSRLASSP